MEEIKQGDVVTLKTGKLRMVVGSVSQQIARCYFEVLNKDAPIQEKEIIVSALQKVHI